MKHIKSYKVFEIRESKSISNDPMRAKYGSEIIDKCDEVIEYIRDILIPLLDLKFYCNLNYTPLTRCYREIDPILFLDISQNPEIELTEEAKTELQYTIESIKSYVHSKHFFLTDYRFNDRGVEKYSMRCYPKPEKIN